MFKQIPYLLSNLFPDLHRVCACGCIEVMLGNKDKRNSKKVPFQSHFHVRFSFNQCVNDIRSYER